MTRSAASVLDALADARTLVANSKPRFGDALWTALSEGTAAVVACLDGQEDLAAARTRVAVHAARKAVPGLRE